MNGRFFIGVLSGAVLISGAFVVGSVMFPVEDGTLPVEVANAPEAPKAPEAVAPAPEPEAEPEAEPEPPAQPEPAPEPAPEPEPEPAAEPVAEPAPEVAAEPEPATAPEAPVSKAEPAAPVQPDAATDPDAADADADADTGTTEAPATTVADGVTTADAAPKVAAGAVASAEPAASETAPAADPSPASDPEPQATGETPPAAEALVEPPAAEAAAEPAAEAVPDAPAPAEVAVQPAPPAAPDLPDADGTKAAEAPPPPPELAEAAPEVVPDPAPEAEPEAAPEPVAEPAETAPVAEAPVTEAPVTEAPVAEAPAADLPVIEPPPQADAMVPGLGEPADDGAPEAEAEAPAPDSEPLPEVLEEAPSDSTFKPTPGLGDAAEGVVIGRLPRIGDAPATEPPAEDAAEAAPEATPEVDARPITAFAATFENPEAKPLIALVLIDTGTADLDRAGLAALPFPVSFALDPLDPATPERAAIYRAAGKEVVMLATGIAEGAQASDVEVAFQSMAQGLPEAVAVMDLAEPLFQDRRPLASIVVPVVGAQGRGLLTWDQGLNAADQVARREDVAAAVVFRDLASAGTDSASVRRLLDRAVFKAGQDGRVAVAGEATPDLVAALLEWTVEGRAATVALAPLTAVLTVE